jgi:hypothetical protein
MQFLDAWSALTPVELARWLALPVLMLLATLLPGRRVTRLASILAAVLTALLPQMGTPIAVTAGWVLLWLFVAWRGGRLVAGGEGFPYLPDAATGRAGGARAGVESGAVALPLGAALLALILPALSRQDLLPVDARRAATGAALVGAGVLHLMMRRHVRRAAIAFVSLGLGLELLAAAARASDVSGLGAPAGSALLAAALAVAFAIRVAGAREALTGTALVSEAHDLHD